MLPAILLVALVYLTIAEIVVKDACATRKRTHGCVPQAGNYQKNGTTGLSFLRLYDDKNGH
jgi:hypothetical protein